MSVANFMHKIKVHNIRDFPDLSVMDISKLGRPWHKLPRLINENFDLLDARLSVYFLKKFRSNIAIKSIQFAMDKQDKHAKIFSTDYGNVAFKIERDFLLRILGDYYGLGDGPGESEHHITHPVSKTEERLKSKLGQEIIALFLNASVFGEEINIISDPMSVINRWAWEVIFDLEGYDNGRFSIFLDYPHVERILVRLRNGSAEVIEKPVKPERIWVEKLFYGLPVTLTGRLVSHKTTVNKLADIRPGDIISVSLNDPVPVFVRQEKIFEATIAEERGKLFFCECHDKKSEQYYE